MYYFYYFYFSSMPTSSKRTQFDLCNTTVLPVCAQNQLHRKMQFDGGAYSRWNEHSTWLRLLVLQSNLYKREAVKK